MEGARKKLRELFANENNLTNLFLAGAFTALSWRSYDQQKEMDVLEAKKLDLRSSNMAMSSTMWTWRQHFFHLAQSDPDSAPISLSRLRSIYGEEEKFFKITPSSSDRDIPIDRAVDASVDEPIIA